MPARCRTDASPSAAVQQTLWERRRHGLDALIVSHADMDHFNGAADLMQSLPVGSLLVSQQFLDFKQPAVAALCESTAACGVPIRLVRDGDRLRLDDGVEIRVLHPPFGRPHSDDNANSIVLSIEFAGRRILLTGDLDGHGQTTLLSTPPLAGRRPAIAASRQPTREFGRAGRMGESERGRDQRGRTRRLQIAACGL